jgi:hypothetical protein
MEVKALPFKVRSDSLSGHAETNHQSEAGIRAELEAKQIATLPLIGRYYGELNVKYLKKRLTLKQESEAKNPDLTTYKPVSVHPTRY